MVVKFPRRDVECRQVVPFQVGDVERALAHVKKFDLCIQAGGNVGIWPKYLSGKFGEVYTFEPDRENFDCLIENTMGIDNIKPIMAALGDAEVFASLDGNPKNCGAYQICEGDDFPVFTIDGLGLDPDFICLDIEGFEFKALMGGVQTIMRCHPVIMYEDKGLSERYGTKKGHIAEFLQDFGYKIVDAVHRDFIAVHE